MTTPHEDEAAPPPVPGVIGTAGMINQLRGPASHVIVDVVDPGVGGATPVRQAMTSLGVKTEKPSTPPALLLSGGIVVGATVVSAGIVNLTPAVAALVFAGVVVFWLRFTNRRARRTDESTRWASRSGQPFGAWEPGAPAGRQRLLIDQRGLAIVDLGAQREPLAVLLWKSIDRLILVPGNERATDPGLVVHRTDGRIAGFTTGFGLHEVMPALDDVGLPTDIEQAMAGTTTARRSPSPLPAAAPAPPADPWANIAPLSVGPAATMGAPSPPPPARARIATLVRPRAHPRAGSAVVHACVRAAAWVRRRGGHAAACTAPGVRPGAVVGAEPPVRQPPGRLSGAGRHPR